MLDFNSKKAIFTLFFWQQQRLWLWSFKMLKKLKKECELFKNLKWNEGIKVTLTKLDLKKNVLKW